MGETSERDALLPRRLTLLVSSRAWPWSRRIEEWFWAESWRRENSIVRLSCREMRTSDQKAGGRGLENSRCDRMSPVVSCFGDRRLTEPTAVKRVKRQPQAALLRSLFKSLSRMWSLTFQSQGPKPFLDEFPSASLLLFVALFSYSFSPFPLW